jgi:hypothetical protein
MQALWPVALAKHVSLGSCIMNCSRLAHSLDHATRTNSSVNGVPCWCCAVLGLRLCRSSKCRRVGM